MTLEGLSGTFWACWASQYLHFHLPAVRGWLPLVANWWLAIPDQEAQVCGRGPSNIVLALNPCLMTWRKGPVNEASVENKEEQ